MKSNEDRHINNLIDIFKLNKNLFVNKKTYEKLADHIKDINYKIKIYENGYILEMK